MAPPTWLFSHTHFKMADPKGDRTSFVNEDFDELTSEEGSDPVLKNKGSEEEPKDTEEERKEPSPTLPVYATPITNGGGEEGELEEIKEDDDKEKVEGGKGKAEPFYENPKHEPDYDEPIPRSKAPPNLPPSYPPPRLPAEPPPTLFLEDEDGRESLQRGGASIAPSSVVAMSDEASHRPLPLEEVRYETIPDSLRGGGGEDADNYDLQVINNY